MQLGHLAVCTVPIFLQCRPFKYHFLNDAVVSILDQ